MVIYLYRNSISISRKYFLFLALTLLGSIFVGYFDEVCLFVLPLLVIMTAFFNFGSLKIITRYGDFSYGFYLFAFPIQQTVASLSSNGLSFSTQTIISFIITILLAILSWNFIEKPCLRLKTFSFANYFKKFSSNNSDYLQ